MHNLQHVQEKIFFINESLQPLRRSAFMRWNWFTCVCRCPVLPLLYPASKLHNVHTFCTYTTFNSCWCTRTCYLLYKTDKMTLSVLWHTRFKAKLICSDPNPNPFFLGLNRRLLLLSVMTDMDPQQPTLTCLQVQNQLEQTRVSFLAFQCS